MAAAKKVVVLLGLHDNDAREKRKVLKTVSAFPGLDLISVDMKASKLTVVGMVDPIVLVTKLRKLWHAEILSVGPGKDDKAAAAGDTREGGGGGGGRVKEEEGDRKHQEVTTAVLVESRPADTRSRPHAVVYPAATSQPPYPYHPNQYVAGGGGHGARENPHPQDFYVAGGGVGVRGNHPNAYVGHGYGGAGENRPNTYVGHGYGYGARKNHPNSYGGQDPNGCAIC